MHSGIASAPFPAPDLAAIEAELLGSRDALVQRERIAMTEPTLESLAKRVEALELAMQVQTPNRPRKDWRRVIGMFRDSEFMRAVDEECRRMREAEREAARQGEPPE